MKTVNAIKKLEKAGAEISKQGSRVYAYIKNDVIEFSDKDGCAMWIKIRNKNDHDDIMTDYSAGVWCDNITRAIRLAMF